jgi:hypothetical protein
MVQVLQTKATQVAVALLTLLAVAVVVLEK